MSRDSCQLCPEITHRQPDRVTELGGEFTEIRDSLGCAERALDSNARPMPRMPSCSVSGAGGRRKTSRSISGEARDSGRLRGDLAAPVVETDGNPRLAGNAFGLDDVGWSGACPKSIRKGAS